MSCRWFVSRHQGARDWLLQQGWAMDRQVAHLDPEQVQPGDLVFGTLPVHLAAEVCARGAAYYHLVIDIPFGARGQELSATDLCRFGATLSRFQITRA